jgi:hypothetical protein
MGGILELLVLDNSLLVKPEANIVKHFFSQLTNGPNKLECFR